MSQYFCKPYKTFERNIGVKVDLANYATKSDINKNTLTGLANGKKTTRHHANLSLCAKSGKTNYAKLRKWPKTSI